MREGYLPVVSPIALSEDYEYLNVDGDRAAAYVAGSLQADKIIFITDVSGLIQDDVLGTEVDLKRGEIDVTKDRIWHGKKSFGLY